MAAANSGSSAVDCDMCPGVKRPASKSCMQCIASYCQEHLHLHDNVPAFKKHKLMEPVKNFQKNMCSKHNEVKKIFCRTDQQCICYLCNMDEHKGHDTVSAEAEMSLKKKKLQAGHEEIIQTVQVLETNIAVLLQEQQAIDESADKVLRENEVKLKQFNKKRSLSLSDRIKQQQNIEVTRVRDYLKRQREELTAEKERKTKLEQLSCIKNPTEFLEKCSAHEAKWKDRKSPSQLQDRPLRYFEQVSEEVSELNLICVKAFKNLTQTVTEVDVLLLQNPRTHEEFLQYSHQLTLDQNTAGLNLVLTEKNKKVTSMNEKLDYPQHPDRFLDSSQVLSTNALPNRCYWEVDWAGHSITVGVAYKDIKREGPESKFGSSDKSWMLWCQNAKPYTYKHNRNRKTQSTCQSCRVGVFLDHKAGILHFYEVSEDKKTNKLIDKVRTTFTQPLYAGLGLDFLNVTAKMCVKEKS